MSDPKRRAIRFPAQVDSVEVVTRVPARVVDESQTGIALAIAGPTALAIGQQVGIVYSGAEMPAIVRRIDPRNDATHLVGLEWQ